MKAGSSGPQSTHEDQGKEVDTMDTSGAAQLNIIEPKCILHYTWRMVVYINNITTAGNSISLQLGSSCQGNRYGTEKAGGTARPSHAKSHPLGHSPPASQAGRRFGASLYSLRLHYPMPESTIYPPFLDFEFSLCEQKRWPLIIVITKPRMTTVQDNTV